jgi:hypothetical protein
MPPRSPECTVPVIEWLPFDSEKGPLTWENSVCDSCRVPDQEGRFSMEVLPTPGASSTAALTTPAPSPMPGCWRPPWPSGSGSSRPPISSSTWASGLARPIRGRRLLTLVHAMLAVGLHRRRRPAALWRHQPGAGPPGHGALHLGTFLRAVTFGHVRQLDRLAEQLLARAWAAWAGPGDGPMTGGSGLHRLPGARLPQAGCRLRPHPHAGLPRACCQPC